jgi:hypothetical protein
VSVLYFKIEKLNVGYCLENDDVAGSWCALVRAQQAVGSRHVPHGSMSVCFLPHSSMSARPIYTRPPDLFLRERKKRAREQPSGERKYRV